MIVLVLEVRNGVGLFVRLLGLGGGPGSMVCSGNGQPAGALLERKLALRRWTGLMLESRGGGKGPASTFHGSFSRIEVDCEDCVVVLVLTQSACSAVYMSSSMEMRYPPLILFSGGNLGLGGSRGLGGNRGLGSPDVAVVPVHFNGFIESLGSDTFPGK